MASDLMFTPLSLGSRLRHARAWLGAAMTPFYWRKAVLCLPGIPLLLIGGVLQGDPVHGAVAAGAAFSVGFGAARAWHGLRWGPMLGAALGMTGAAFLGTLTGQWFPLLLTATALVAAGCAALALIEENAWWITLQAVIAWLVASYYPGPLPVALSRCKAVLVGGIVQMGVVIALASLFPQAGAPLPPPAAHPPLDHRLLISHMIRAAVAVVLALLIARALGLANSYWAPMTALLVLKPHLHETHLRGTARLTGTVAGCAAATLYAIAVKNDSLLLLLGLALTASIAFAFQKAHYATLTCAITATVVLLLSLGHGRAFANAEHRLIATVIGGVIALAIARIAPHSARVSTAPPDRVGTR